MNIDAIPADLVDREQWVVWRVEERNGKVTKVPYRPEDPSRKADVPNQPAHRTAFETALECYREHDDIDGIGFVFAEDDLVVGIDLDDCRDPDSGELEPWAAEIVERVDSYTEVSPSDTGVHILGFGAKPGERCRTGDITDRDGDDLEIYDNDRFFTVTGEHVDGTPEQVERRPKAIKDVYAEYLADDPEPAPNDVVTQVDLEDADLIEKAKNADDGGKFNALWTGDVSGYQSQSEADLALVNKLAFWTGGDRQRIDALFRQSGLYREKWDREDYRNGTIDKALKGRTEFYDPSRAHSGPVTAGGSGEESSDGDESEIPTWDKVKALFKSDANGTTTEGYAAAADRIDHDYNFVTVRESGALYFYNSDLGYWIRKGGTFLNELLEDRIPGHTNPKRKRAIREAVRDRNYIPSRKFNPPKGKVNVQNGVVDLDTRELENHSPKHYFTSRVEAEWPEDGTVDTEAVKIWLETLSDCADDPDERRKIEEFIGYCLETWHHDREKNMFFPGPPLSGKSTIQEAIEALFGTEPTVTNLTPQQIADTQFDAASLREAALNTVNDINSTPIKDTGTLKRVFSGERMKMEHKFQDAHFAAPKAKHLFTANWLPRLVGQDDAVYRRILLVEFTKTIEDHEKDRQYKKRLKRPEVQQVILKRAVDARDRLHEQDGFTNDRTPDETRKLWDSWRDGHKRFLYSQFDITGDPDDVVDKRSYWQAYREFAARKGYEMKSNRAITDSLQWVPEVYTNGDGDEYGGLKWRDFDAADPDTGSDPAEAIQRGLPTQDQRYKRVRAIVTDMAANGPADLSAVIEAATEAGIDEADAEHAVEQLKQQGTFYEPKTGTVALT